MTGQPLVLVDARKARDLGIGRHIVGLVSALAERSDLEIAVVARREDADLFPPQLELLADRSRHYSLAELISVRRHISRLRPDLFHAPHYVVPFRPPCATVVTVHDLMHLTRPEHAGALRRVYARIMIGRAVRLAARVITVSRVVRDQLAARYPEAETRLRVIPNGVSAAFSPSVPRSEKERVRQKHGLPDRYLLFLGNDKPHKNLEGLLRAYARLRVGGLSHGLVIAGGEPDRATLREALIGGLSGGHPVRDLVRDLGRVPDEDVPPLLAAADALVLPSLDEGFGLPVVEAQACGTPVACSNRGGLPEAAGGAAVLFDPGEPDEVVDAIRRVLLDPALRAGLVSRGLEHARSLSWASVAAATARVYDEALSRGPA